MSSNKGARERLIQKYGRICMMEAAGIRYIPVEKRRTLKGYKKTQEMLTYHHIKPLREHGETTEENGAVLKEYNHAWLEQQPQEVRDEINEKLQQFKLNFSTMSIGDKGLEVQDSKSIDLTFEFGEDSLIIPAYDTTPEQKKALRKQKRARDKRETQKIIREYYESFDISEDDDFER